jgi:predicted transcriptional regulator
MVVPYSQEAQESHRLCNRRENYLFSSISVGLDEYQEGRLVKEEEKKGRRKVKVEVDVRKIITLYT